MRAVLSAADNRAADNPGRLSGSLVTEALPTSNIPFMRHPDVLVAQWPPVPPEAVSWMLPELEPLARDMAAAILSEVPEYGRPDDDSYARMVHRVARDAVHQFAARVADPAQLSQPGEPIAVMFHDIGRVEAAQGRSLDALHAALRVGARVTWQRLRAKAREGGADADVFARLGESIFRYLDELAAACSAGYAQAKAEFEGDAERLRRRLLELLVAEPPTPPETIASLAATLGWGLPRRVVAVALAPTPSGGQSGNDADCSASLAPFPPDALLDLSAREPYLLMPDPDGPGRRQLLDDGLRKWPATTAAVGPSVPLAHAAASLRWARRALALARRDPARHDPAHRDPARRQGNPTIVHCDEQLPALVLVADPELARVLIGKTLAPLRGLRPDQAQRLADTLLAWLESADNAGAAAARLHVHPQTVRYRLRQLSELFGEGLSDPESRFALQVALRARRLVT
jgi:PucR C-terminal helix-turn-helix domain/GGDEF-like domain